MSFLLHESKLYSKSITLCTVPNYSITQYPLKNPPFYSSREFDCKMRKTARKFSGLITKKPGCISLLEPEFHESSIRAENTIACQSNSPYCNSFYPSDYLRVSLAVDPTKKKDTEKRRREPPDAPFFTLISRRSFLGLMALRCFYGKPVKLFLKTFL